MINKLELSNLNPQDVKDIFTICPGCIYWELPNKFAKRPSTHQMRLLKKEWLTSHGKNNILGKVAREEGRLKGFIQFGPTKLYPQQFNYKSGPVSPDAMLITCLFIAKEYRRRGLARLLLSLAEEVAQQYNYAAIEAFARKGSTDNPSGPIELFLAYGFEILKNDEEFPLVRKVL